MSEEKSSVDEDKLLTGIYEELSYIDGGIDVKGIDSITTFLPQISKSKKEVGVECGDFSRLNTILVNEYESFKEDSSDLNEKFIASLYNSEITSITLKIINIRDYLDIGYKKLEELKDKNKKINEKIEKYKGNKERQLTKNKGLICKIQTEITDKTKELEKLEKDKEELSKKLEDTKLKLETFVCGKEFFEQRKKDFFQPIKKPKFDKKEDENLHKFNEDLCQVGNVVFVKDLENNYLLSNIYKRYIEENKEVIK